MISGKTFKEKAASHLDSNPTINVPILKTVSVFFLFPQVLENKVKQAGAELNQAQRSFSFGLV